MSTCGCSQHRCSIEVSLETKTVSSLKSTSGFLWKRRQQPRGTSSSAGLEATVMLILLVSTLLSAPVSAVGLNRHHTRSNDNLLGSNGGNLNYPCQPGSVPTEQRCAYLAAHDDVCRGDGLIPYLELHYCWFNERDVFSYALFTLILLLLFQLLLTTAERFFCPSLQLISEHLHLSPAVAGATLLAFGNGAPDLFTQLAAIQTGTEDTTGEGVSMAISEPLGSGLFVGTIAFAAVILGSRAEQKVTLKRRFFLKDILFYLGATSLVMVCLIDGQVHLWQCLSLGVYYTVYVCLTIWMSHKEGDDAVRKEPMQHEVPHLPSDSSSEEDEEANRRSSGAGGRQASMDLFRLEQGRLLSLKARGSDSGNPRRSLLSTRSKSVNPRGTASWCGVPHLLPEPIQEDSSDPSEGSNSVDPSQQRTPLRRASLEQQQRRPAAVRPQGRLSQLRAASQLSVCRTQSLGGPHTFVNVGISSPDMDQDTDSLDPERSDTGSDPYVFQGFRVPDPTGGRPPVLESSLLSMADIQQTRSWPLLTPSHSHPPTTKVAQSRGITPSRNVNFAPISSTPEQQQPLLPADQVLDASHPQSPLTPSPPPPSCSAAPASLSPSPADDTTSVLPSHLSKFAPSQQVAPANRNSEHLLLDTSLSETKDALFSPSPRPAASESPFSPFHDASTSQRALSPFTDTRFFLHPYPDTTFQSRPTTACDSTTSTNDGVQLEGTSCYGDEVMSCVSADEYSEEGDEQGRLTERLLQAGWRPNTHHGKSLRNAFRRSRRLKKRVELPLMTMLSYTMPRINTHGITRYSKVNAVLLPVTVPLLVALYNKWLPGPADRLHLVVVALPCVIACVLTMILYPKNGRLQGPWLGVCTLLAFLMSMAWMDVAANELVNLAQALGTIWDCRPALLSSTLLSWGNSLPDLISNYSLSRDGYPTMAVTACFASPIFTLLMGMVVSLTYEAWDEPLLLSNDFSLKILNGSIMAMLLLWVLLVPLFFQYTLDKRVAGIAVLFYLVALTCIILAG